MDPYPQQIGTVTVTAMAALIQNVLNEEWQVRSCKSPWSEGTSKSQPQDIDTAEYGLQSMFKILTVENPTRCNSVSKFLLFLILNEAQHVLGDTPPKTCW